MRGSASLSQQPVFVPSISFNRLTPVFLVFQIFCRKYSRSTSALNCDEVYNASMDGRSFSAIKPSGASTVYNGTTLLITGDMSAQYDIGALAAPCITPKFKMIVLCNGGGARVSLSYASK